MQGVQRQRFQEEQKDVNISDEQQQQAIVENLEAEAAVTITRESNSLGLLCGVLALVAAGLAVCEVISPWSRSLPHERLRNSLPHWGLVATHGVSCLAHLVSLMVIFPRTRHWGVDFVGLSLFLSFGIATVWLTAIVLSGHFWSWLLLLVVKNPVTFYLAWDCARDRTQVHRSILDLRQKVYKFKVV